MFLYSAYLLVAACAKVIVLFEMCDAVLPGCLKRILHKNRYSVALLLANPVIRTRRDFAL